jgi:hypothetical protein
MLWIRMCVCHCNLMDELQHLKLPKYICIFSFSFKRLSENGIIIHRVTAASILLANGATITWTTIAWGRSLSQEQCWTPPSLLVYELLVTYCGSDSM